MKIVICDDAGCFTDGWVKYCQKQDLPYEVISPLCTDFIQRVRGATHMLWHWYHSSPADCLVARQIIQTVEGMGVKVFPNMATCWHFDDKLGQKYLLEAQGLPLAPTWAFYSKESALAWAKTTTYPKVFKLRAGAGSKNVKLVRSYAEAKSFIGTMFGKGIPAANVSAQFAGTAKVIRQSPMAMLKKLNRIPTYIRGVLERRMLPRQVGYCMFQEFIPGNTFDTRIVVIGNRAIGIRRLVKKNDFRASGSGMIEYDPKDIDVETVRIGFESAKKLKTQSLALDLVRGQDGRYWIIEISFGFSVQAYYKCPGYWDGDLQWHDAEVKPEEWILTDLVNS